MNGIHPRDCTQPERDTDDDLEPEPGYRSTILPPPPSFMVEREEQSPIAICEDWEEDEVSTLRRLTPAPQTWRSRVA